MTNPQMKPEIVEINAGNRELVYEFLNFIFQIFPGAKFLEWWERGFWGDYYKPFSILRQNKIISNVSASLMDVIIRGEKYKAVQIGAVGTIPEYRNQGLSRILMDYVLNKYESEADLFFLFANQNVLEFYPKFGFKPIPEKIFQLNSDIPAGKFSARKLNLSNFDDYNLLQTLIKERQHITESFGAENYRAITMWHIFNSYKDSLYYLSSEDAIIIKKEKKNEMHIRDVIYRKPFDILPALSKIIESETMNRIIYYFPPDQISYPYDTAVDYNSYLFIKSKIELSGDQLKFPETAKT